MEFHESKTLTLPIARHESLTANVFFNLASHLAFVVIGKMGETILPVAVSLSVSRFYILVWFIFEIDLVVFLTFYLANLSTVEIIAIYGIMMLATYMLFTIALAD